MLLCRSMKSQKIFFLTFFLATIALLAYIFMPFFTVIILGMVAASALLPLHAKIKQYIPRHPSVAAFATVACVVITIGLLVLLLGTQLANQAQNVYTKVVANTDYDVKTFSETINNFIAPYSRGYTIDIQKYVNPVISFIAQNVGSVLSGTASVVFKFVLWLVTIYFILRDGSHLKTLLKKLSPLEEVHDERIINQMLASAQSIARGVFFVALIQGFLVGLGLFIVGIGDAVFWGLVAAIAAPIPLLGTSIILLPSIAYLIITTQFTEAIILVVWGAVAVGLVDNILAPYFYSRGTEIHALILLFSILGGLSLFGAIGFIVGPLVATITITLIDLYQEIVLDELPMVYKD